MLIDPQELNSDLDRLEEIEKSTLRMLTQAIYNYRATASEIFRQEGDQVADIGEDITREALDRLGMPRIDKRLFGKVDYKRACYLFHPEYAVQQALFVESKAENISAKNTARLQTSQISMAVRQSRAGVDTNIPGRLPTILSLNDQLYLTTTAIVKYNYKITQGIYALQSITVAVVPNGMLQEKYNPTVLDHIWLVGPDSPTRGEDFRVRLSFRLLKGKAPWRVQSIPMPPNEFVWDS